MRALRRAACEVQADLVAVLGNRHDQLERLLEVLRVEHVAEGFGWGTLSEADVDEAVRDATRAFERLRCTVSSVSIPWHRDALHVWNAIAIEGATALMVAGNSMATNWKGHYTTSLLDVYAPGRLARAHDLSETVKLTVLLGQYLQGVYHGRYYAKAQNLARALTAVYDAALAQLDLLVMPTLPLKATPIPAPTASLEEYVTRALEMIVNTCPFDVTGHPAMNVPCAMSEDLPIGLMLVGRTGGDATVLRAADAVHRTAFASRLARRRRQRCMPPSTIGCLVARSAAYDGGTPPGGGRMPPATYKLVELVGVSDTGVDDAIRNALTRAGETLKGLDWFQVTETRGVINDGQVTFQVTLKVGFRILSEDELRGA